MFSLRFKDLESDEDLFGESKKEDNFSDDESPFRKKGGMFSGGESLFTNETVSILCVDPSRLLVYCMQILTSSQYL